MPLIPGLGSPHLDGLLELTIGDGNSRLLAGFVAKQSATVIGRLGAADVRPARSVSSLTSASMRLGSPPGFGSQIDIQIRRAFSL
jgi:hypothetical protein